MARKKAGLGERHKRILKFLEKFQAENGYPPSIREIGENTNISSTSVVNYYLNQLEEMNYIERESNVSRGNSPDKNAGRQPHAGRSGNRRHVHRSGCRPDCGW